MSNQKDILNRLYFIAGCMFVFAFLVVFKLVGIQMVDGDKYRHMAEERTIKDVVIPANRGNVYSAKGNLLAASVPKYDIRFDALTPSDKTFNKYLKPLSAALAEYHGRPVDYYVQKLRKARASKNRYLLLARDIGYSDYIRFRNFPMLELGAFKGGLIVEQTTKREYPMGGIALRSIGYERFDDEGKVTRAGIDGAFGEKYLRGVDGKRLKQKIGKGQWKPIQDFNQIEPQDGYDVYTTIDVNIQDIAHHALLKQLEYYEAEHGCAVVMEVATGEIKAISNLARSSSGTYYEKRNYAVYESHEPGSTFKTIALMAALEDKVVDTATIVDTGKGRKRLYGRDINDAHHGGFGEISVGKVLEVSSNIGMATIIDDNYAENPEKFLNRLKSWELDQPLGVSINGEGTPMIPEPGSKKWSKNALPSMAYGYNLKMTPLQILTFYNAIANNGEMVKPKFLKEVREFDKVVEPFSKEVINSQICSKETLSKIKQLLTNVVEKPYGTGHRLYSENFSMAGKTGTAQTEYWMKDWSENKRYISSFAGFFPVDNPKYSCIVVIHKPSIQKGYYGADVSGPVFKRIAQKIFTDTPIVNELSSLDLVNATVENEYEAYYKTAEKYLTIMPDVEGLPAMDAIALLENMGLRVEVSGTGTVTSQSIDRGVKIKKNQTVVLKTS